MIDRRQFFKAVTLLSAGVLIPGARLMRDSAIGKETDGSLSMVIYDERIPASCAFARSACRDGMSAVELKADIGQLWHNTIRPRLRLTPHRLLGLTLASDLFLLKLLAADAGMKILHEVPQSPHRNMVSWVIASGLAT